MAVTAYPQIPNFKLSYKKNGGLYSPAPMAWIKTTLTYIRRQQVMKERPVDIATIATIRGPRVGMSSGAL